MKILADVRDLKISDIARELIEIGTAAREVQETRLTGSLRMEVPFENIDLGGDQERLNLYIDEELFSLAQKIFEVNEQAVLRKALRLGAFYVMPPVNEQTVLPFIFTTDKRSGGIDPERNERVDTSNKRIQSYKEELRKIHTVESYIITDEIEDMLANQIFPNLNFRDNNTKPILISGAFGSGKSHLINFIVALSEEAGLLKWVNRPEITSLTDNFAGYYVTIFLSDHPQMSLRDEFRRKIRELCGNVDDMFNYDIENTIELSSNLMDKFKDSYPSKGLLVIMDLFGINENEKENLFFIRELIEVSRSRHLKLIVELDSNTAEKLQDFISGHFTKIHLEIKDIEDVLLRARPID